MRKMYIQPKLEISKVAPTSIVCASGEIVEIPDPITGQAPKRRTEVF